MLLGDVNMENEAFETALQDYNAALEHQAIANFPSDDRRTAELHFKKCCALQFMNRNMEALEAVTAAVEILQRRKATLAPVEGDVAAEVAEVDAVLEDLKEKMEELEAAAKEEASTKAAVRGVMEQLGAAMEAPANDARGAESIGFDKPASLATTPVKDLGVVGRGTKRLNLAPMPIGGEAAEKKGILAAEGPDAKKARAEALDAGPKPDHKTELAIPAFLQAFTAKESDGVNAENEV